MGGDEPARTLIAAALGAGKAVVTANKHVIAHHGPELEAIARRSGAALRFEAAVGGGIPVLSPLAADLAANTVSRVRGIVNGTTNFILTSMGEFGQPYEEVLAEAQAHGYAEADPRGDVEGDDAVNKVVILARLAFGTWIDPASVLRCAAVGPRPGPAGGHGRHVGGDGGRRAASASPSSCWPSPSAVRTGAVEATVLPTAVPANGALGGTDGVLNRVEVRGEPIGNVAFSGPGAGGDATSSAVLGDLLAIARHGGSTWAGLAPAGDGAAMRSPTGLSIRSPSRARGSPSCPGSRQRSWSWARPRPSRRSRAAPPSGRGPSPSRGSAAALAPHLPDGVDVTLYPVTD